MTDPHLEHYGVKGMKWGVRNDRMTGRKSYRRRSAAGQKINKSYAKTMRKMVPNSKAKKKRAATVIIGAGALWVGGVIKTSGLGGVTVDRVRAMNAKDPYNVHKFVGDFIDTTVSIPFAKELMPGR